MYITVTKLANGSVAVSLEQPDDCGRFQVEGHGVTTAEIGEALHGVNGGSVNGDHAWIEPDYVRSRATGRVGHDWNNRFAGMLAYATKQEWLDAQGRVRAHCELM